MKIEEEIELAKQYYQQKKFHDAGKLFESIASHLESNADHLKSAEMKNNASVAFLMNGEPQKAFDMAKDTHLIFESASDDKNCGLSLGNQASALEHLGEKGMALQLYKKAIGFLEKSGDKEPKAIILKRISSLQIQQGNQLEALGSMTSALNNIDELTTSEKILKRLTDFIFKIGNR
jgi:tetratricopeptide (TPR) repeat protein